MLQFVFYGIDNYIKRKYKNDKKYTFNLTTLKLLDLNNKAKYMLVDTVNNTQKKKKRYFES